MVRMCEAKKIGTNLDIFGMLACPRWLSSENSDGNEAGCSDFGGVLSLVLINDNAWPNFG